MSYHGIGWSAYQLRVLVALNSYAKSLATILYKREGSNNKHTLYFIANSERENQIRHTLGSLMKSI